MSCARAHRMGKGRLLYGIGTRSRRVGHPRRAWPHGHCLFLRDAHALRSRPRVTKTTSTSSSPAAPITAGPHQLFAWPKRGEPFDIIVADAALLVTVRRADVIAIPATSSPHYFYDRLNETIPIPIPEHGGGDCAGCDSGGSARGHPGHHRHGAHLHLPAHARKSYQWLAPAPCRTISRAQAAVMDVIYGASGRAGLRLRLQFERAAASLRAQQ